MQQNSKTSNYYRDYLFIYIIILVFHINIFYLGLLCSITMVVIIIITATPRAFSYYCYYCYYCCIIIVIIIFIVVDNASVFIM